MFKRASILCCLYLYAICLSTVAQEELSPDKAYLLGNDKYNEWEAGSKKALKEAERYYSIAWEKFQYDVNFQEKVYFVRYALASSSWDRWSPLLIETYDSLDPLVKSRVQPPELLKIAIDLTLEKFDDIDELQGRVLNLLKDTPESIRAWLLLSQTYVAQKNFEAGIEAAKKARDLQPESAELVFEVADLYYRAWSDQQCGLSEDHLLINSLKYLLEAHKKEPENSFLQARLSLVYRQVGLFPLAVDFGEKAFNQEKSQQNMNALANAYLLSGQYEDARKLFKRLARKHDKKYNYHMALLAIADNDFYSYKKHYKKVSDDVYPSYTGRLIHNLILRQFALRAAKRDMEDFGIEALFTRKLQSSWDVNTYKYFTRRWSDRKYFRKTENRCDLARGYFFKGLRHLNQEKHLLARCAIKKSMEYGVYSTDEYYWSRVILDSELTGADPGSCADENIIDNVVNKGIYPESADEFIWAIERSAGEDLALKPRGLAQEAPDIPKAARSAGIEGYAIVRLAINGEGKVETVELIEESPRDFKFGEAAVTAAWKRRFYPKVEGGKVTAAEGIKVKYNFNL